ncbi:MAG: manganese efflux pump [Deltaproteobacteria bacterium]|nr:manganese efflux pump [Deltaproteobacteria bacterium]
MTTTAIFIIAVGLGMDAFSVAVGIGASGRKLSYAPVLRLATAFGFFQFIMPIAGWLAGMTVANLIANLDHWIAFVLLSFIGGKMIWESFQGDGQNRGKDPTTGLTLLMLAVATSIDALAVGLSFAFLKIAIFYASLIIGVVAFFMTAVGAVFGKNLGKLFGKRAELIGGLVLISIGIKILFDHMVG